MKKFTLEFYDKELEVQLQKKEYKDRILLLKLFLVIKVCLAIIEILFHLIKKDPILNYKQGFVAFGCFFLCLLILLKFRISVSSIANFVQLTLPVISILTNLSFTTIKPVIPSDLFMFGGFKSINMVTLYFLGTNFKSNSFCYVFSSILVTYWNFPNTVTYNTTNYIAANIWVIGLKYIVERDTRSNFLLKVKDESWTLIMKDVIDDWVVVVTHNSQMDQIRVRDANQNFMQSCGIHEDKCFRNFARSMKMQDDIGEKKKPDWDFDHYNELSASPKNLMQSPGLKEKTKLLKQEEYISKKQDLDQVLRKYLLSNGNQQTEFQLMGFEQPNDNLNKQKVMKYIGYKFDSKTRKYTKYSIRLIRGSDSESFILLVIKELKNQQNSKHFSHSKIMQQNMVKISNLCDKYLQITQKVYNEFQKQTIKNSNKASTIMQMVTSKILTLSNSQYVQQLYLNQTYQMKEFKFESPMQQTNVKEMIKRLQLMKKKQIKIIFNKNQHQNTEVYTFQRELMQLCLIFIENTLKHSKIQRPTIKIDYFEYQDVVKFKFYDDGQGISSALTKQLLNSYRVDISKQMVIILEDKHYEHHIIQKMKYGWVSARLLLSILSPFNDFEIDSEDDMGTSITFSIYSNISEVVNIRNLGSCL